MTIDNRAHQLDVLNDAATASSGVLQRSPNGVDRDVTTLDDLQIRDVDVATSRGAPSPPSHSVLFTGERRRPTNGARISWADPQPFIRRVYDDETKSTTIRRWKALERAPRRKPHWRRTYALTAALGDACVSFMVMAVIVSTLRVGTATVLVAAALSTVAWLLALLLSRGYDSRRLGTGPDEFQSVFRASWLAIAVIGVAAYMAHFDLSRRVVLIGLPLAALLTGLYRYLLRRDLHRRRRQGGSMLRTLVVGDVPAVAPVVGDLTRETFHGYSVVGACVPHEAIDHPDLVVPSLGTISDIPQVVVDDDIDVVIVAGSQLTGKSLRRLSWALDRAGAELVVSPGVVEVAGPHIRLRPTAGLSLLHLEQPSRHMGRELGKAVLDRVLGSILLTLVSVPVAVMAMAVMLTSPGPAFFRQVRAGVDGQPFTMWKLRTMVVDAENRRSELHESSDRDGLMFKMRSDPRITPVGRVLRRFSLDELPQLWNVVKGDMSLVGPRPPLMSEFQQYRDAVNRRLRVRPGVTGLWQVSGRADLEWEESINLDLRYVDNWSLALDLQILWKTVRAVVHGSGAY